jgi:multiple sugar transport system permease protein
MALLGSGDWIQIVPWGASVFGIFLVRQFFIT